MTDCTCSNFPSSLGLVTFGDKVGIGVTSLVTNTRLQIDGGYLVLPNGDSSNNSGLKFLNTSGVKDAAVYEANDNNLRFRAGTGGQIIMVGASGTYAAFDSNGTILLRDGTSFRALTNDSVTALQIKTYGGSAFVTFDSTNERVGIGTASPAQKLAVAGVIESTTGGFKFPDGTVQTTAGGGGGGGTEHSLNAADGSPTDVVYVNNDGNVGVGTTTPQAKLDVSGGSVRVGGREVINANGQALYG
jgi:hypothetical protein